MENLEHIEHRYRQIIDELFSIAAPGPIKNALWQAYQQVPKGQFQATQKELDSLRQWKKDWMPVMIDWSEKH